MREAEFRGLVVRGAVDRLANLVEYLISFRLAVVVGMLAGAIAMWATGYWVLCLAFVLLVGVLCISFGAAIDATQEIGADLLPLLPPPPIEEEVGLQRFNPFSGPGGVNDDR